MSAKRLHTFAIFLKPRAAWLKEHGTSLYSVCLLSDGPIENDEALMKEAGYESIFKQEKGYEAYEYFDTSKDPVVIHIVNLYNVQ